MVYHAESIPNITLENPFEARLCAALCQLNAAICDWDFLENTAYFSENFTQIIGTQMGRNASPIEYLARVPVIAEDCAIFKDWILCVQHNHAETQITLRIYHSGGVRWINLAAMPMFCGGVATRMLITIRDITRECEERERLCRDVLTDPLTGLQNKQSAMTTIEGLLNASPCGQTHALFLLDLDNFKAINDNYGHYEGDKVLASCGAALRHLFCASDTIGRIGGDEFIALIRNCTRHDVQRKGCEICAYFGRGGLPNISVGVTLCHVGCSFEKMFIAADRAMYKSKASGKNTYTVI